MFYKPKAPFKKIISLLLIATVLFSVAAFSGCAQKEAACAVTLNEVGISNDVFVYFLDEATVELGTDAKPKDLEENVLSKLSTYFKTNSLAQAHNIVLSIGEKSEISEKVNGYWSMFGGYYSSIGVSKETLTRVFTAEAYRDKLMLSYYGEGGTEEIPLSRLYAYFKSNYVLFQSVTGYFTQTDEAGLTVKLPDNEIEALVLKFQGMADVVNSGEKTLEETAEFLAEDGLQSNVQTVVLHKDDTSYPAGFFNKIKEIDTRYAAVIGTSEYIFLVIRAEADANSTFFKDKKTEIIKLLAGDGIDPIIEGAYTIEGDVDSTLFNDYLQVIKTIKGDK